MEKYKDFEAEDFDDSEQGLRNLFVKRCYLSRINSPLAKDLLIYDPERNAERVFSREEIEKLRTDKANIAIQFPENMAYEWTQREIRYLNPDEPDIPWVGDRVKAYRQVCRKISQYEKPMEIEKPKSWRRVYSFVLAEAYHRGNVKIDDMSKKDFKTYVTYELKMTKAVADSIYQTVRSTYKNEKSFIYKTPQMMQAYPEDYAYAMKIYKDYFPENNTSFSK